MYSYVVDDFIDILKNGFAPHRIDDESQKKVETLFRILDCIKPVSDNSNKKSIWIYAENGPIEDYIRYYIDTYYDECDDDGDVEKGKDEALEDYKTRYHGDGKWYKLETVFHCDKENEPLFGVIIAHEYVLSVGDPNSKGYPIDASDFIDWIIVAVEMSIEKLKNHTYDCDNLPYENRYGKILRKDYWDIYPEERECFRQGLSQKEIDSFLQEESYPEKNLLKDICTARDYYEICAIGYHSVNYDAKRYLRFTDTEEEKARYGTELTPKEMYYCYADGRDDGLCNVPMDDPNEFELWTTQKGDYFEFNGHHPYEIVTSGSLINSIHLYPSKENGKWHMLLSSSRAGRSAEIVRMFLAMRKAGVPVELFEKEIISERFTEIDQIGILPTELEAWSPYSFQLFPEKVSDVINLPDINDPKRDLVIEKVAWLSECIPELVEA